MTMGEAEWFEFHELLLRDEIAREFLPSAYSNVKNEEKEKML